jgi:purine-nucleoside phosphorylase
VSHQALDRAVDALRGSFGDAPSTALVLGSGLGTLVSRVVDAVSVDYGSLGLPTTGVGGHAGCAVVGQLGSQRVILLSGRVHLYEGRPLEEVVRAVRAVARWGVERVIVTNAVGGIDPSLCAGSLFLVEDHINLMGANPLEGEQSNGLGPRFPDMSTAYHPALRKDAAEVAAALGISLPSGVYVAFRGPSYETPAEIRMLSTLGASTVGMSLVPEAIALAQMQVPTLALSMVSNLAAGLSLVPLRHEEVSEAAAGAVEPLGALLEGLLERWS